jgi:hypothetical protein
MLVETAAEILQPISRAAYGDLAVSFYVVPIILGVSTRQTIAGSN